MDNALNYIPTITDSLNEIEDYTSWNLALERFEEGEYRKAFLLFLRHLDPSSDIPIDDKLLDSVTLDHGSIRVKFEFTEDTYNITAPFVKIPSDRNIPILRRATELNFSTLGVSQIELNNDFLRFNYQSHLQLSNPYKLYEILQEICLTADKYDDVFVEKFNAEFIVQPEIKHYSKEQKDLCWDVFQSGIKHAQELSKEFEQSHEYNISYFSVASNLMKISNFITPQGYLKYQLDEIINEMHNNDSIEESIRKSKKALKKLLEISRDKFDTSLYYINTLVNSKRRIGLPDAQSLMSELHGYASQQRSDNNHKVSSMIQLYNIHKIMYYRKSPKFVEGTLVKGLTSASGKEWNEASSELWRASSRVMDMEET